MVGDITIKMAPSPLIKVFKEFLLIKNILEKIDTVYKILFCYFELRDKVWLSYFISEKGFRFKLSFSDQKEIIISPQQPNDVVVNDENLKTIREDAKLSVAEIEINGKKEKYFKIQLDIANKCAFDGKEQKFYPEIESFD